MATLLSPISLVLSMAFLPVWSAFSDTRLRAPTAKDAKVTSASGSSAVASPSETEEKAASLFLKRDFKSTIQILSPINNSLSRRGTLLLAKAFEATGDHSNQTRILENLRAKDSKDVEVLIFLARGKLKLDQVDSAIADIREAIKLNPKDPDPYALLLKTFLALKEKYEARVLLKDMIKKFGDKPDFWGHLCEIDTADGFIDEAVKSCTRANALDSKNPNHLLNIAKNLENQKETSRAESILIKTDKKFPGNATVATEIGRFYFRSQNFPVSVRYLQAAVQKNTSLIPVHLELAQALFEVKDFEKALTHFIIACQKTTEAYPYLRRSINYLSQNSQAIWSQKYTQQSIKCRVP